GLKWLGLDWDEGPFFQSQRLELYRDVAQRLLEAGRAYQCFCTPEELEARRREMRARGIAPRYDRRCRNLSESQRRQLMSEGHPYVLRLAMPLDGETVFHDIVRGEIRIQNVELDDFVIVKSDGFPTYNFACVVDDHDMGITHVIRGEDHISNTPRQIQLYRALNYPVPQFAHLPLLLGQDRSKLSKRHGAVSLLAYRDMGVLPEAMFNFLALLGWSPGEGETQEIFSRDELIQRFDLNQVKSAGAIFNMDKLAWMNGHYIRVCPTSRLMQLCLPYLQQASYVDEPPTEGQMQYVERVLPLVQERMRFLSDVTTLTEFFFTEPADYEPKGVRKWLKREGTGELLLELAHRLEAIENFDAKSIEGVVRKLAHERGISAGRVIHPVRVAITGRTVGPGLFELMEVLGKERCIKRLHRCIEWLKQHEGRI
ncbi:MAG TPA: glutamate--tRNA ligase, partial [Armatimonadetes bacterium]|nr:glutamate--tRNA ligase [Armatimonadota bacterium]